MSSDNTSHTPTGIYLISGLFLLMIGRIIYDAFVYDTYFYFALVFTPLLAYAGIGILKNWSGAKTLVAAFSVLFFLGAIPTFFDLFFTDAQPSAYKIFESTLLLAALPAIYFYFRKDEVNAYFEPSA